MYNLSSPNLPYKTINLIFTILNLLLRSPLELMIWTELISNVVRVEEMIPQKEIWVKQGILFPRL